MINMEDIFVIVNGKAYRANFGAYMYNPNEIGPTLEVETVLAPSYEVTNPKTSTLIANVHADIHLNKIPEIVDVIFNDPATIVLWSDGTKTVVKTQEGEPYDPEKGMAMAFSKKLMGDNKRDYYHTFLHYLKKYNKQQPKEDSKPNLESNFYTNTSALSAAAERFAERIRAMNKTE